MKHFLLVLTASVSMLSPVYAQSPDASGDPGVKTMSGMSILGNDEAPTSLVIVPWKSSELGDGISIGNLLDDRARPVDREVFQRELSYYQVRSGSAGEPVSP